MTETITRISEIGAAKSPEGRMERFKILLDEILPDTPGNLLEIGAGNGLTTKILLQAAEKFNRKVLVIDPFESAWDEIPKSYGEPYPFNTFYTNVRQWDHRLIICRHKSLAKESMTALEKTSPFAFAFVDGLQFHNVVYNELKIISALKVPLICVDDFHRMNTNCQVPTAVAAFLGNYHDYKQIETRQLIEGYLCR